MSFQNSLQIFDERERAEEAIFCTREGANLAQGYYFGKPSAEPIRKYIHDLHHLKQPEGFIGKIINIDDTMSKKEKK